MSEDPTARLYAFFFRFGRRASIRGFDVRAMLPDRREWPLILAQIDTALGLLEAHTPIRYALLRRDIARIWVTGIPSHATYVADRAMCVLNFEYVTARGTRPEEVALTLVHEGAHARLRRWGFGYEERVRPRIERVCIGSELVVARRLPGAEDLAAGAEERLWWDDGTWSDAEIRGRHLEALESLGWPGRFGYWIGRASRALAR